MITKERVQAAIKYLISSGFAESQKDLAEKIGFNATNLSQAKKGEERYLTEGLAQRLSTNDSGINLSWLLTGEGEMLTTDAPVVEQRKQESEENEGKLIPLLPLSAEGGSLDGFDNLGVSLPDCEVIYSPIKDADMAITVSGKSMEPDYPEGCRVVVKRIDHALFIEWGREYVLDTANGIVLKTLEPSDDPNFIRCTSLNPDQRRYAPFEIPKESVRGVYRVHLMMGRK